MVILVFAPLLGLVLDRFVFRKLSQASEASKIMATVGVLIAVPALAQWVVALLIGVGHFNIPDGSLVSLAPGIGPEPASSLAHWARAEPRLRPVDRGHSWPPPWRPGCGFS